MTDERPSSQQWQVVQSKRKREAIKRTKMVKGDFKGAKRMAALYVGRCDMSVETSSIKDYIVKEIEVPVISCTQISNQNSIVKSFKVEIDAEYLNILLNPSVWPENVVVRRFFYRRNHDHNRN